MHTKEKIRFLVEERKRQAVKEQISQKMVSIAKNLGSQIVRTSVFNNRLPDVWQMDNGGIYFDDESGVRTIEEDDEWVDHDLGFAFDGLKCGINLCIMCLAYDNKVVEIKATYNGYIVYAEIEGEIKAFAPFPAWLDALKMFYEGAIAKEKARAEDERSARNEDRRRRFAKFWEAFKMLWGF